jgi:murein DD-endopeptidase MepM/ murein hydrolase activator NlpD
MRNLDPKSRGKSILLAVSGIIGLIVAALLVTISYSDVNRDGNRYADWLHSPFATADVEVAADQGAVADLLNANPSFSSATVDQTAALDGEPVEDGVKTAAALAPMTSPMLTTVLTEGELEPGDSLASALRRSNVPNSAVHVVTREASSVYNFRRAQPGHSFVLTQDLEGRVLDFRYRQSTTESIHVFLDGDEYVARRENAKLTPRVSRVAGIVNSSLYGAIVELGEEPQLANDFTDVFAWDVDFSRTTRPGDEFKVLYERLYYTADDGSEIYAGPGRILAARYGGEVGEHTAIYFEQKEGRGAYYRPDGTSVERQFLMAPLRYTRITSGFTQARRHPILKITRPHHGIDYAAKHGSPVWSVANGEVIYRGWAGGFGNLVKVRHDDGYVSYYSHLSRFDKIKVGDRVEQKQVVGYVGQTGLATGPHVCFRIAKNGSYVNPARILSPPADPVSDSMRATFDATRDTLLSELDSGPFVATGEAL